VTGNRFWSWIKIWEAYVLPDRPCAADGGKPNKRGRKTKCERGRETVINMKGNEQMPMMNMNNEREGEAA